MGKLGKKNPSWWTDQHSKSWDHVKEAFARDWEQTKADFSKKKGHELQQNVGDTVKQAAGKQGIPPRNVPNDKTDYARHEPAFRYGYSASTQFSDYNWDEALETKLRTDWEEIGYEQGWDDVRQDVHSAWNQARKH